MKAVALLTDFLCEEAKVIRNYLSISKRRSLVR